MQYIGLFEITGGNLEDLLIAPLVVASSSFNMPVRRELNYVVGLHAGL
jgi:hypothetical protein